MMQLPVFRRPQVWSFAPNCITESAENLLIALFCHCLSYRCVFVMHNSTDIKEHAKIQDRTLFRQPSYTSVPELQYALMHHDIMNPHCALRQLEKGYRFHLPTTLFLGQKPHGPTASFLWAALTSEMSIMLNSYSSS